MQKTEQFENVNEKIKYEREIIKILLLYGNRKVDFEQLVEEKEAYKKKEYYTNIVAQEIYLSLQEDETEFTNTLFQKVYFDLINQLNQDEIINTDSFINHSNNEIASLVTDILMDDEEHVLSDWERRQIQVKQKDSNLSKLVMDAIYNLRRILIEEKIESLKLETSFEENYSILDTVVDYTNLKSRLSERLNRVL